MHRYPDRHALPVPDHEPGPLKFILCTMPSWPRGLGNGSRGEPQADIMILPRRLATTFRSRYAPLGEVISRLIQAAVFAAPPKLKRCAPTTLHDPRPAQ